MKITQCSLGISKYRQYQSDKKKKNRIDKVKVTLKIETCYLGKRVGNFLLYSELWNGNMGDLVLIL